MEGVKWNGTLTSGPGCLTRILRWESRFARASKRRAEASRFRGLFSVCGEVVTKGRKLLTCRRGTTRSRRGDEASSDVVCDENLDVFFQKTRVSRC